MCVSTGRPDGTVVVLVEPGGERTMLPDRGAAQQLGPIASEWLVGVDGCTRRRTRCAPGRSAPAPSTPCAGYATPVAAGAPTCRRSPWSRTSDRAASPPCSPTLAPDVVFATLPEAGLLPELRPPLLVVKDGPNPVELRWADGRRAEVPVAPVLGSRTRPVPGTPSPEGSSPRRSRAPARSTPPVPGRRWRPARCGCRAPDWPRDPMAAGLRPPLPSKYGAGADVGTGVGGIEMATGEDRGGYGSHRRVRHRRIDDHPGDHVCGLFFGWFDRDELMVPFFRAGLAAGDTCMVVTDRADPAPVVRHLGTDAETDRWLASGRLQLRTHEHQPRSCLHHDEMVQMFRSGVAGAMPESGLLASAARSVGGFRPPRRPTSPATNTRSTGTSPTRWSCCASTTSVGSRPRPSSTPS